MKKLRQFNKFDCEAFFKDKDVRVLAHEDWNEYEDGEITKRLGTKYKCVIATDNTIYGDENEATDVNGGEQVDVKVPHAEKEYKKFSKVSFVKASASVYGTFQNELSVVAEDVKFQEK